MKFNYWLFMLVLVGTASRAQAPPGEPPLYVESFRKGATRITERAFEAELSAANPHYETKIQDSTGADRYLLSVVPVRVDLQDPNILAWRATLIDLHRKSYGDLLVPYRDEFLNESPKGNAAKFDPNPYAQVPLTAFRIIKVENFYCSFQVKRSHRRVPEQWQLDSMLVEARFSNHKPEDISN